MSLVAELLSACGLHMGIFQACKATLPGTIETPTKSTKIDYTERWSNYYTATTGAIHY
jgi:hypothetical protein